MMTTKKPPRPVMPKTLKRTKRKRQTCSVVVHPVADAAGRRGRRMRIATVPSWVRRPLVTLALLSAQPAGVFLTIRTSSLPPSLQGLEPTLKHGGRPSLPANELRPHLVARRKPGRLVRHPPHRLAGRRRRRVKLPHAAAHGNPQRRRPVRKAQEPVVLRERTLRNDPGEQPEDHLHGSPLVQEQPEPERPLGKKRQLHVVAVERVAQVDAQYRAAERPEAAPENPRRDGSRRKVEREVPPAVALAQVPGVAPRVEAAAASEPPRNFMASGRVRLPAA